jgi:hypothetical protein
VSSLGKGYYEFVFTTLEDVRRIRSIASWNLNLGLLKLFAWSKDFNPMVQQNNSAQVWVRFYGVSQEYWRLNILFAIACSIGTPICLDPFTAKPMLDRTFGQFARVLVDIDLSQTLRDKVLVERVGFAFFVDIDYENLPPYCTNCKMIGHHVGICKRLHYVTDENIDIEAKDRKKQMNETHKIFVPKSNGRVLKNKEKECVNEVVIVGSDKVVPDKNFHDNTSAKGEAHHIETINLEVSADKAKSTHTDPTSPLVHHNRFALLIDSPVLDPVNSKQYSTQKSPVEHASQRSKEKRQQVDQVEPAAVFKEQDKNLEF